MRLVFLFVFLFSFSKSSQATFSIVAVDAATGEVGSAGASCLDQNDCNCPGVIIISGIIPGRGAMNSQAYACLPNINLTNGIEQMNMGLSPQEALDWVVANDACGSANFNSAYRQYGIADLDVDNMPRSAAFTGASTDAYAGHIAGINYAIQGNILLGEEILTDIENAFLNTEGSLADKLMAALQGANVAGADTRCLADGISSKSAYVRVAKPDDTLDDLYLDLNMPIVPNGGEPIDALQVLFDEWKLTISPVRGIDSESVVEVYPNPTDGEFIVEFPLEDFESDMILRILDLDGKVVFEGEMTEHRMLISEAVLGREGLYFLEVLGKNGLAFTRKIVAM